MSRWPENYDEEDCYGDVVSLESLERDETEGDRILDERQMREIEECDPDKITAAIEAIRYEWEAA